MRFTPTELPTAFQPVEIAHFVAAMFRHATPGSVATLRSFEERRGGRPLTKIWAHPQIGPQGPGKLHSLTEAARRCAGQAANHPEPAVFCPPVATFAKPRKADEAHLVDGLALSVDVDTADPRAARATLEGLLGPATCVVATGGLWTDPSTGEVAERLHLHWRLSTPTRSAEEHKRLKMLRAQAAALVGADASGKPIVHPLRWPGSVHRKGEPRPVRIIGGDAEAELSLDELAARLPAAEPAPAPMARSKPLAGRTPVPLSLLMRGVAILPNPDVDWRPYREMNLIIWAASGGQEYGRDAFHAWARKSGKYDHGQTDWDWDHVCQCPPTEFGPGTFVERVREHDKDFYKRRKIDDMATDDEAWRGRLYLNAEGNPRNHPRNAALLLQEHPRLRGRIGFDEREGQPVCRAMPWLRDQARWRLWEDADSADMVIWASAEAGVNLSVANVNLGVLSVARQNSFDEFRDELDNLPSWDRDARGPTLLERYFGARPKDERERLYLAEAGKAWLNQLVERTYVPGCQADHALILCGGQGLAKSSALRALAGGDRWFADNIADFHSKDAPQDMRGKAIVELAELTGFRRSDRETIKAFVSRRVDRYRASYGRFSTDNPRRCIFAGSTNEETFLNDPTGNRRFWPVTCIAEADVDGLRRDREQIMAEALYRYCEGQKSYLSREVEAIAEHQREERTEVDHIAHLILEWAGKEIAAKREVTTADVITHFSDRIANNRSGAVRVGNIFRAAKWTTRRKGHGPRHYIPGSNVTEIGAEIGAEEPQEIEQLLQCSNVLQPELEQERKEDGPTRSGQKTHGAAKPIGDIGAGWRDQEPEHEVGAPISAEQIGALEPSAAKVASTTGGWPIVLVAEEDSNTPAISETAALSSTIEP